MKISSYLKFRGNCLDALSFYKECFGGDFSVQTYASHQEFPKEQPSVLQGKVMHAEFVFGDLRFYASDVLNVQHMHEATCCNSDKALKVDGCHNYQGMVDLSLEGLSSETQQTEVFDKLSCGGSVEMPLQDTFWGARFGILRDKFGIRWLLNFEKGR